MPYYHYNPDSVLENENHRLYWDRTVLTDRTIPANRPDIIWVDKNKKTTFLIDVAVPNANNIQETFVTKITKYAELAAEIQQQWKQKSVRVVPVVLSATGIIPKSLKDSLTSLGIEYELVKEMQKSVILNTCQIVRKFLSQH